MNFVSHQSRPPDSVSNNLRNFPHYLSDKKVFITPLLASDICLSSILIILSLLLIWSGVPRTVIFVFTAALATRSPEMAIKALIFSYFLSSITPAITNVYIPIEFREERVNYGNSADLIGRYIVMGGGIIGALRGRVLQTKSNPAHLKLFALFGAYVLINSLVWSYAPLVSISKSIYYLTGVSLVLYTIHFKIITGNLLSWIVSFFGSTIILGMPLALTLQGYIINGVGFQGLYVHPQTLGVIAGIFSIFALQMILENRNKTLWIKAFLGICLLSGLFSLYLSGARTGVAAFIVGSLLSFPKSILNSKTVGRTISFILIAAFAILFSLVSNPSSGTKLQDFVLKKDAEQVNLKELWKLSRGDRVDNSIYYFEKNPVFGVGFGLPGDPTELIVKTDPIFNLPIGASVEKGFIGTAVLEELGITGMILGLLVLMSILGTGLYRSSPVGLALIGASLGSNIGEATIMSFGGLGGMVWIFVAIGLSAVNYE